MKIVSSNLRYDLTFTLSPDKTKAKLQAITIKDVLKETNNKLPTSKRKISLFEVIIPEKVSFVNDNNQEDYATVEEVSYAVFMDIKTISKITFPNSIKKIGLSCCMNCSNLEEVILPEELLPDGLGASCFKGCISLTKINIPQNLEILNVSTFEGCKNLKEIDLNNKITKISDGCFFGSGLQEIYIPDSVEDIDMFAFQNCDSLTDISLPDTLKDKKIIINNLRLNNIVYRQVKTNDIDIDINVDKTSTNDMSNDETPQESVSDEDKTVKDNDETNDVKVVAEPQVKTDKTKENKVNIIQRIYNKSKKKRGDL